MENQLFERTEELERFLKTTTNSVENPELSPWIYFATAVSFLAAYCAVHWSETKVKIEQTCWLVGFV